MGATKCEREGGKAKGKRYERRCCEFGRPKGPSFPCRVRLFSQGVKIIGFPSSTRVAPVPISSSLSDLSTVLVSSSCCGCAVRRDALRRNMRVTGVRDLVYLGYETCLRVARQGGGKRRISDGRVIGRGGSMFQLITVLTPTSACRIPSSLGRSISEFYLTIGRRIPGSSFFGSTKLGDVSKRRLLRRLRTGFVARR